MKREDRVVEKIKKSLPEGTCLVSATGGIISITIPGSHLLKTASILKEDPELRFNYLSDLCGVDYPERESRFEVVYHFTSIDDNSMVKLKVPVSLQKPVIDSITSLYPSANWFEREVYDMFGITFRGHPDMRRILMPEGWRGHPLRKDYSLGGEDVTFSHNKDFIEEQELPFRIKGEERQGYLEFTPDGVTLTGLDRLGIKGTGGKIILNMGPPASDHSWPFKTHPGTGRGTGHPCNA